VEPSEGVVDATFAAAAYEKIPFRKRASPLGCTAARVYDY
jgi:hypothetical protein